jgi:hypothetical protein
LFEFEGRTQLKDAHEFKQAALRRSALGQDMGMVWHQAIGVEKKRLLRCAFQQARGNPAGNSWLSKMVPAHITTDGYKIDSTTDVVL